MEATYRALCAKGFANLTTADIAEEAGKSTSLLHYHYDTKEELLVSFLAFLLERFEETVAATEEEAADERLRTLIDRLLPPDADEDKEWAEFNRALLEVRCQAPYREAYREQLQRNKTALTERFAEVIRKGIEEGTFRDVDPEETARFVMAAIDGARAGRATLGDTSDPPAVRAGLSEFVLEDLCSSPRSGETGSIGERRGDER